MTICLATTIPSESSNGVATFNKSFLHLFKKAGHKLIYLFVELEADKDSEDYLDIKSNCITVILKKSYHHELKKYTPYFRPGGSNAPKWIAAGLAIRKWLLNNSVKYNIDVVEISDGGGIGLFQMNYQLPPTVLTAHGSNLQISRFDYTAFDEQGRFIKKMEKIAYRNASAIISHSPLNTQDLKQFTNRPIYTLPIPWFASNRIDLDNKENNYGLVVGALRNIKGPDLLCKTLLKVQNVDSNFFVKWIGSDTDTVKGYKSVSYYLQKQYPTVFQKSLRWGGAITNSEILEEIKNALFIVIPSVWETFNYVAIEAAYFGKPIIITKNTGASYLFENKVSALIIESDEEELNHAMMQLKVDKELRKSLGRNAQKMVFKKLEQNSTVNNRIEVYEKVIRERKLSNKDNIEQSSFLKSHLTLNRRFYFNLRSKVSNLYKKLK